MDRSVVPFDVNAGIFFAFPIHSNLVVFFECHLEVTSVAFANVFHSKIVNEKNKGDGAPLVAPQSRCGSTLVVSILGDAFLKQSIG